MEGEGGGEGCGEPDGGVGGFAKFAAGGGGEEGGGEAIGEVGGSDWGGGGGGGIWGRV